MSFPSVWDAERLLATSGVIAAVVRDVPAVVDEGLAQRRAMFARLASDSDVRTINTPFHYTCSTSGLEGARVPGKVGADSLEILSEAGVSQAEIESLVQMGLVT